MHLTSALLDEQTANTFLSSLVDLPENDQYPHLLSFYNLLLTSQLLVPLLNSGLDADQVGPQPFFRLAFTHKEAFKAWAEQSDFDVVSLPFVEICNQVLSSQEARLTLNLSGPYGCTIELGDLLYLQNGFLPPPRIGI
jgi:hypothetical protein